MLARSRRGHLVQSSCTEWEQEHVLADNTVVFYWHRPLGAREGTYNLTIQQARQTAKSGNSSAVAVAVWSLPLTLADLMVALQQEQSNPKDVHTLQVTGNAWDLLPERVFGRICAHLRVRRLHVSMGVASRAVCVLLKLLRPRSLAVWTLDATILDSLDQLSLSLMELKVIGTTTTEQHEALLLKILKKQQNTIRTLYLNPPVNQWKALFQIIEDSTSLQDFQVEPNHHTDYLQCMVKANWYRHVTGCDAVWTVWKDWYRATHRPDLNNVVHVSSEQTSTLMKRESGMNNCT